MELKRDSVGGRLLVLASDPSRVAGYVEVNDERTDVELLRKEPPQSSATLPGVVASVQSVGDAIEVCLPVYLEVREPPSWGLFMINCGWLQECVEQGRCGGVLNAPGFPGCPR